MHVPLFAGGGKRYVENYKKDFKKKIIITTIVIVFSIHLFLSVLIIFIY